MENNHSSSLISEMEYLVGLLHKEWERPGQPQAEAIITLEEAGPIYGRFALLIQGSRHASQREELGFARSMELTKENYLFLRILKKMKAAEEKAIQKGEALEFSIALDREECQIFRRLILAKE